MALELEPDDTPNAEAVEKASRRLGELLALAAQIRAELQREKGHDYPVQETIDTYRDALAATETEAVNQARRIAIFSPRPPSMFRRVQKNRRKSTKPAP